MSSSSRQVFLSAAKELATQTATLVKSIKELALSPSDEAREHCKASYEPILEGIDGVLAFAWSDEFASAPPKIMGDGILLQKPILNSQKAILAKTEAAVNDVKLLCTNSDDQDLFKQLGVNVKGITEAIQNAYKVITAATPGTKDCEDTIEKVTDTSAAIDQAIIESAINSLDLKEDIIEKSALSDSIRAFSSLVEVIAKTVISSPSQLGQTISATGDNYEHIVTYTIATASHVSDLSTQKTLLDELRSASDCLLEFLFAIKGGLAGTKNVNHAKALENGKKGVRDALGKLGGSVEGSSVITGGGELAVAIEKIEALQSTKFEKKPAERRPYPYYADKVEESGKALVELVGEILSKTKTAKQYNEKGAKLADVCQNIHECVQLANLATDDVKIKSGIDTSFRELLVTSVRLVEAMHAASGKSNADQASRQKLTQSARQVSVNVSELISAAKEGTKGLLSCQESIANINDVISDLESCIIFSQAGQLDPVSSGENFGKNKDGMMNSAKAFVELVKGYITTVSGSQDEFAALSLKSVASLEALKYVYLFNYSGKQLSEAQFQSPRQTQICNNPSSPLSLTFQLVSRLLYHLVFTHVDEIQRIQP